jgi:hypothetical protein
MAFLGLGEPIAPTNSGHANVRLGVRFDGATM